MRCDECKWGVFYPEEVVEVSESESVIRHWWGRNEVFKRPAYTYTRRARVVCHYYWPQTGFFGMADETEPDWFCKHFKVRP